MVLLAPVETFPKLRLAGFGDSWPVGAAVPVPLTAMVRGEPLASLVMVTLPVTLPVEAGEKVTVRVAACDALIVTGLDTPLELKPVPPDVIVEIWTAAVPVFVSVICFAELLPEATLPKLRLVGLACNWPTAALDPEPVNVTFEV